jgi:hypothetical protein
MWRALVLIFVLVLSFSRRRGDDRVLLSDAVLDWDEMTTMRANAKTTAVESADDMADLTNNNEYTESIVHFTMIQIGCCEWCSHGNRVNAADWQSLLFYTRRTNADSSTYYLNRKAAAMSKSFGGLFVIQRIKFSYKLLDFYCIQSQPITADYMYASSLTRKARVTNTTWMPKVDYKNYR